MIHQEVSLTLNPTPYAGWQNCLRLSNGQIELIATADVGPRVIRLGFVDGENLFHEFPEQAGEVGGEEWRAYGGHRFWHAPEDAARTYWPDNAPVRHEWDGATLRLIQEVEENTGLGKEIELTLDPRRNHVRVVHRLINFNLWTIEAAPWALSVMAPGGRAIFPQEPFRPHPDALLPARALVIWPYTNMADPRFRWGERFIQLRQDPTASSLQKFGLMNTRGWGAYELHGQLFLKRFAFDPHATYADFGCNTECFTNAEMLEVESLGPLTRLAPGASVEHVEHWVLERVEMGPSEESVAEALEPVLAASEDLRG